MTTIKDEHGNADSSKTTYSSTNRISKSTSAGRKSAGKTGARKNGKKKQSLKDIIPESEMNLYHVYYNLIHRKDVTVCSAWKQGYQPFRDWAIEHGYKDGARVVRIDKTKPFQPSNTEVQIPAYNQNMKRLTALVKNHENAIFKVSYKKMV